MKEKNEENKFGRPIIANGPAAILMSTPEFSKWMSMTVSPEFLNEERTELFEIMSKEMARNPEFLQMLEHMLEKHKDEIYDRSPSNAELREYGYGWPEGIGPDTALVPPAIAAAALAPAAAALAAAHAPGE